MGIGTSIVKGLKFAAKVPFYDVSKMTAARKAVKGSIFCKAKRKAALGVLKNEYKAIPAPKTFREGLRNVGKALIKPFRAIGKSVKRAVKNTVKIAKKFKAKGVFAHVGKWLGKVGKGALKCCKSIPLIGTIIGFAVEIPGIIRAFKEGGFGVGMAKLGMTTLRLGLAAAACIGGTILGGPVVGGALQLAVDVGLGMLEEKIMNNMLAKHKSNSPTSDNSAVKSDTDDAPAETTETTETAETTSSDAGKKSTKTSATSASTSTSATSTSTSAEEGTVQSVSADSLINSALSSYNQNLGANLGSGNLNFASMSNPFTAGTNFGLANPFLNYTGMNTGLTYSFPGNNFGFNPFIGGTFGTNTNQYLLNF